MPLCLFTSKLREATPRKKCSSFPIYIWRSQYSEVKSKVTPVFLDVCLSILSPGLFSKMSSRDFPGGPGGSQYRRSGLGTIIPGAQGQGQPHPHHLNRELGKNSPWRRQWHPTPVLLPGKFMDGGAWWAAVSGVAQSRTRLKRLSSSSSSRDRPPKEQMSFNFMAAVTVHSDFGAQENKVYHCFYFFRIYLWWSYGTRS